MRIALILPESHNNYFTKLLGDGAVIAVPSHEKRQQLSKTITQFNRHRKPANETYNVRIWVKSAHQMKNVAISYDIAAFLHFLTQYIGLIFINDFQKVYYYWG